MKKNKTGFFLACFFFLTLSSYSNDNFNGKLYKLLQKKSPNIEELDILLNNPEVNVNYQFNDKTPLIIAAIKDKQNVVARLLKHDQIDVNAQRSNGQTALMLAINNGNFEIANLLLNHKSLDINIFDNDKNTALIHLVNIQVLFNVEENRLNDLKQRLALLEKILSYKNINVNHLNKHKGSALLFTAGLVEKDLLKTLVEYQETNVNIQSKSGETALLLIVKFQYKNEFEKKELIEILLTRKELDLYLQDKRGRTIIDIANDYEYNEILVLLK